MAAPSLAAIGDVIHIEAEDCILGGLAALNVDPGGTIVDVASDDGDMINVEGVGTMTFPDAIPDGDYILEVYWMVASWDDGGQGAYDVYSNGGTVTLKDSNGNPNIDVGWHSYYPAGYGGGNSPFFLDQYVGPDSAATNTLNVSGTAVYSGSPVAAYMSLENIGAGEFVFTSWEMSTRMDC